METKDRSNATTRMLRKMPDAVFVRAALTGRAFVRIGEPPEKAIARLTRLRAREIARTPRQFPKSTEDLSSTAAYMAAFYCLNSLGSSVLIASDTPTVWPENDEIRYEEVEA